MISQSTRSHVSTHERIKKRKTGFGFGFGCVCGDGCGYGNGVGHGFALCRFLTMRSSRYIGSRVSFLSWQPISWHGSYHEIFAISSTAHPQASFPTSGRAQGRPPRLTSNAHTRSPEGARLKPQPSSTFCASEGSARPKNTSEGGAFLFGLPRCSAAYAAVRVQRDPQPVPEIRARQRTRTRTRSTRGSCGAPS